MESSQRFAAPMRTQNGVDRMTAPGLSELPWLWHGFSTIQGGVSRAYLPIEEGRVEGQLNLGFTAADPAENVNENRLRWIEAVTGTRETALRTVRQVHSCESVTVGGESSWVACEADGLMTAQSGVLLGIMTADCIPVLVADPVRRAVAAFHAGWRGTVERIVELGITRMGQEFGSDPGDLVAAIGPGIGHCCYEVGDEVRSRFGANFAYAEDLFCREGDRLTVNLWEGNRRQLLEAGLTDSAIGVVGACTCCNPEYFYSHRASGGHAGRMMAVIGIR